MIKKLTLYRGIPKGILSKHIVAAIRNVIKNGIPKQRNSKRYFLKYSGKNYPPKYILSIANIYANNSECLPSDFNAIQAKDFLIRLGFEIRDLGNELKSNYIESEIIESNNPEGRKLYRFHRKLERDSKIGKTLKKKVIQETGELRCMVCDFSFLEFYGEIGKGYIEAHHLIPVSQLDGKTKTNINDIALVCSNCHRMLHAGQTLLSINQLKKCIRKN